MNSSFPSVARLTADTVECITASVKALTLAKEKELMKCDFSQELFLQQKKEALQGYHLGSDPNIDDCTSVCAGLDEVQHDQFPVAALPLWTGEYRDEFFQAGSDLVELSTVPPPVLSEIDLYNPAVTSCLCLAGLNFEELYRHHRVTQMIHGWPKLSRADFYRQTCQDTKTAQYLNQRYKEARQQRDCDRDCEHTNNYPNPAVMAEANKNTDFSNDNLIVSPPIVLPDDDVTKRIPAPVTWGFSWPRKEWTPLQKAGQTRRRRLRRQKQRRLISCARRAFPATYRQCSDCEVLATMFDVPVDRDDTGRAEHYPLSSDFLEAITSHQ
jgi:hypothetical protein